MSTELVERAVADFLASPDPEVMCIRGKWGVGKTFSWNVFLNKAKDHKRIALDNYAYISLFGLNSLDELKYAVFENSVKAVDIGVEPSLETFKTNTLAVAKSLGRKSFSILQGMIFRPSFATALQSVSFLSVRKMIVCIDDLERKGDNLAMKDVLGLVSHLRDQKHCKVVLITNEDALQELSDGNKQDYEKYSEKVVDISLDFAPEPIDCVQIAIKGNGDTEEYLRECMLRLNISNIRVLKKIERLVLRVAPLLNNFHPRVLRSAVHTLTLLGWCENSGEGAPSIKYLIDTGVHFLPTQPEGEVESDHMLGWKRLLENYGFAELDELDLVLLDGVKHGYFDEDALKKPALNLDGMFKASEGQDTLMEAWQKFHESFDDNEDEIVNAILKAFKSNIEYLSPTNLNSTVELLIAVGRDGEVPDTIRNYMDQHDGRVREFFDLEKYAFAARVNNDAVRSAFGEKYNSFEDKQKPFDVLLRVAENDSWSAAEMDLIANLSVKEFYEVFKTSRGKDLNNIILYLLRMERIVNLEENMKHIPKRVREALVQIGKESAINLYRVKRYGVSLED